MPAINPTRLKVKSARLAEKYLQPGTFVRGFHDMLSSYTDQTQRPGKAGEPPALLASYNVPPPVIRQVWLELSRIALMDTQACLILCDALWAEPCLEHRLLAATLLGQLPVEPAEPILQRLAAWTHSPLEVRLMDVLVDKGMHRLRRESADRVLQLSQEWLQARELTTQQLGMQSLIPLIKESSFENFPAVFRLLTPFLRLTSPPLRPDLLAVLTVLAHRSPQETAFTLRKSLEAPDNPDTAWIIRQIINQFPEPQQVSLRQAMKP